MCTYCVYHTCTACTIAERADPRPAARRPGDRSDGPPRPFAEIGSVPHRDRSARALRRLGRCRTPLRAEASIHLTKHAEKPEPATAVWPTTAPATPQWARRPMRWSARTRPGASPARTGTTPSDTGTSCPNLTQRHPALESSVEKIPEYQRFSSRSPIGSGPLRQIWTRGAHLRHLTRSRGRPVAGTPGTGAPVPTTTAQRQAHDSATDPDMSISRAASGEGRATSRRSHRAPAASWPESSPRVEFEEHDIPPKILSRLRGNLRSDDGTDAEIPEETLRTPQRSLVLFRTGAQLVLTTHDTPPFWTPLTQLPEISEAWLCEKRRRHPRHSERRTILIVTNGEEATMPHLLKNLGPVDFSRDDPSRTESDSTQQKARAQPRHRK